MIYSKLGDTDIEISKICLGTMTFGEQNTENEAHEQLDFALDNGVNFIDTAEMYPVPPKKNTQGLTEKYIGSWLNKTKRRKDVIIASKVTGPAPDFSYIRDPLQIDKENIEIAIEKNLKRSDSKSNAYAVCADSRSESIELLPEVLQASSKRGVNVTLIYLDAQSPTLVKRFSETRRKHPLTSADIDLREAVNLEAKYLESIAELANLTIDTTSLTSRDLEAQIREFIISNKERSLTTLIYRKIIHITHEFIDQSDCNLIHLILRDGKFTY